MTLEKSNEPNLEEKISTTLAGEGLRSPSPAFVSGSPGPERERGIDRASEYLSRLSSLRVAVMVESINQDRSRRGEDAVSKGTFLDAMVSDTWRQFVKREVENLKVVEDGQE